MNNTVALNENKVFRALYARGKSAARRSLVVYMFKNRYRTVNRLGITVSTKLGGAVVRNRARRRLKEAYRLNEHIVKAGADIVIVARRGAVDMPFEAIVADMLSAFGELSLLSGAST